ncbi:amino acid adenylation domain-containing protein [Nocardia sp. CA-128927]|uniref:non-ribosomal peptide synthetase n=1 Tax=Nocardia sp. CA-128927 TaxID=3239975 RepID=UPI003D99D3C5
MVDDPARGPHLVAFYTADHELAPQKLRAHLATVLPPFMIPARFERIDRIPLNPSGKTDRSALHAVPAAAAVSQQDEVATGAEGLLAEVFSEVLGVASVGRDDDFFARGGDSVLALKVCALAGQRGLQLTARDFVTHTTVAQLARAARPGQNQDGVIKPFALIPESDRARMGFADDAYPLARLQWGMLYHSIESESSTLYHDVFRYSLRLPWDEQAWLRAGARLVQRHPALRTSFNLTDFSEPLQIVHREVPLAFATTDLRALDAQTAAARIEEYVDQQRHRTYRLDAAPLYAVQVFRMPETVDVIVSFHHAILDGWSVAMLMSQLLGDYLRDTGHQLHQDAEMEILPSYAEFVRAEREAVDSEPMRRFWAEELREGEPTRIGELGVNSTDVTETRIARTMAIPTTAIEALRLLASEGEAHLSTMLFTVHCLTLRQLSGSESIVTGLVTSNRPVRLGSEQVAGLFLNTVPIRVGMSDPHLSPRDIAEAVRAQRRRLIPYYAYPLATIQRDRHGAAPILTAFNYVHFHMAEQLTGNPAFEVVDVRVEEQTNLELMVSAIVHPADKSVTLRLDGDGIHVTNAVAEAYLHTYLTILDTVVADPGQPIGSESLASPRPQPLPPAAPIRSGDRQTAGSWVARTAEHVLGQVFSEVLGEESVRPDDDFFVLGGDSLLVLKVCALAGRRGLRITTRDVLDHPTIAQLAQVARPDATAAETVEPFALVADIDRARLGFAADAYPLAQLQWGMIYHSIESESSTLYHDVFRYSLRLPWDEQAWRRAGAWLVHQHPALRTSFDINGFSQPLQIVHHEISPPFASTDLTEATPAVAAAQVADHIQQRRTIVYRLDRAPLFEVHAFRLPETVEVVFSFHHAILDGWSAAVLMSQLLQTYLGYLAGTAPSEPSDPPTYAEFIRAEQQALASSEMRRFWQETLRDSAPTALGAATQAGDSADRVSRSILVPSAIAESARGLAARERMPLKSILLAAHCLTLSLFAGSDQVTTGVVTHNRQARWGAELVAGLFLNTMPVPVDLSAADTWRDVIAAVRTRELQLDPYRAYPLSVIQQEHDGMGVVTTAFNYVHFHIAEPLRVDPRVEIVGVHVEEQTNFALLLNAIESPLDDSLRIRLDADGVTVDEPFADAYTDAYLGILHLLAESPDAAIDFTPLVPPVPLAGSRPTSAVHVVEAIMDQVRRTPNAPAVVHGGRELTYQELWDSACRIGSGLCARGAVPGTRVGLAATQSPERIAAVVGIALAGAAVVPLDVGQPAARVRDMLDDAAPLLVVTEGPVEAIPAELTVRVADLLKSPLGQPNPLRHLEQTAYVLFTSGSTGRPKAVTMPHRVLATLIAWQLSVPSGRVGDRAPHTAQFAPLTFDVAFQEIFSTLCGGGTLQLADDELRTDARALVGLLESAPVERVFLPYVALEQLAHVVVETNRYPKRLSRVVSSGEQLRITPRIKEFLAALPEFLLLEKQYGPTETHVASYDTRTGDPREFPLLPPIGRPIAGAEIHVVDSRLRPVPVGALGEIYLGGACVADGYEHRPDLTAQRYIADPTGRPGQRLYRTGDLGRRHPDGYVMCAGRIDTQVKIRGFRVETAEIESTILAAAPAVREAAVVARGRDGTGSSADTMLVAYLVGDAAAVDIDGLRRQVAATLPAYEVPARIEWLDSLPRTASGKRADAVLRGLPLTTTTPQRETVPPRDELDRELVGLVADIVGIDTVGIDDSFFDLGGTSITVTRLVLALEQRYGIEVPMSSFVAAPTVRALAELLRLRTVSAPDPLVAVKPSGQLPPLFLVHPLGGTVSCYAALARHLPADQPLFALQAAGVDAGTSPLHAITDMAASYIEAIRRRQPHGPYHLGGWSLGGFVAFEMLHQLESAGEEVASFILLDSMMGQASSTEEALMGASRELFMWELLRGDRGVDSPAPQIPADLTDDGAVFQFILDQAIAEGLLPDASSLGLIRRLYAVFEATWQAAVRYRAQPTGHDLTLLRSSEPLPEILKPAHDAVGSLYRDATNGWGAMTTGAIDVVDVPGNHLTMMDEPYVATLAETLAKVLEHDAALHHNIVRKG